MFLIMQRNHVLEFGQFLFECLIEVIAKYVDCTSVSLVLVLLDNIVRVGLTLRPELVSWQNAVPAILPALAAI